MGEGKYVLDMAKLYINRYAIGVAANLEGSLLSLHQRGCYKVVSYRPPGRI